MGSPGNMVRVNKRRECSYKLLLSNFDVTIGHKNEGLGLQIKCVTLRVFVKPSMRIKDEGMELIWHVTGFCPSYRAPSYSSFWS